MSEAQTFSFTVSEPVSIPAALSELSALSQTRIKHAMTCGAVWCNRNSVLHRLRRSSAKVNAGDEIIFHYLPEALDAEPLTPELIVEEPDYSVWRKPAGMTVSGSRYADHTSLKRWIEINHRSGNTVFIVHRLDRFTQGLIVVAHNKSTAADLSRQFRERTVEKRYHAIVVGDLANNQTINTPLDNKPAVTHVQKLKANDSYSLLEIRIDTGRKHQIRRHLTELGHPVLGDRQYGDADTKFDLQLAATGLTFKSPSGYSLRYKLNEEHWPKLPSGS